VIEKRDRAFIPGAIDLGVRSLGQCLIEPIEDAQIT
jgi:hypothetical protein